MLKVNNVCFSFFICIVNCNYYTTKHDSKHCILKILSTFMLEIYNALYMKRMNIYL